MDELAITSAPKVQKIEDTLPQVVQYAPINVSSSGANTLVASDPTRKIKVQSYIVVAAGTVTVTFKSNSTALTGPMPLVVNSGVACPPVKPTDGSYFQTAANEALVLTLSDTIGVTGHLSYYLE
jgi:hypothetical protein